MNHETIIDIIYIICITANVVLPGYNKRDPKGRKSKEYVTGIGEREDCRTTGPVFLKYG